MSLCPGEVDSLPLSHSAQHSTSSIVSREMSRGDGEKEVRRNTASSRSYHITQYGGTVYIGIAMGGPAL